MPIGSKKK